jgi:hypothetical protein
MKKDQRGKTHAQNGRLRSVRRTYEAYAIHDGKASSVAPRRFLYGNLFMLDVSMQRTFFNGIKPCRKTLFDLRP